MFANLKTGVEVFLRGLSASEVIFMTVMLTVLVLLLLILLIQKWISEDIRRIEIQQTEIIESLNVKLNRTEQQNGDLPYFTYKPADDLDVGQATQLSTSEIAPAKDIRTAETVPQPDEHLRNDRLKIAAGSEESDDAVGVIDKTRSVDSEAIRGEILTFLRRTKRPTEYKDILRHVTRNLNEDEVSSMNEIVFEAINHMEDQGDLQSALLGGKLICKLIDK